MKKSAIILSLMIMLLGGLRAAGPLKQQFWNPPEAMKPHCSWYWLNGDITKDLEVMAVKAPLRAQTCGMQAAVVVPLQEAMAAVAS